MNLHITAIAERDLIGAADYIEFNLHNPQAADALLDEADDRIGSLADYPEQCSLVDDPVLQSWRIRFLTVKKYLAFYIVSEEKRTIFVVRFLHSKRDWITILRASMTETEELRRIVEGG